MDCSVHLSPPPWPVGVCWFVYLARLVIMMMCDAGTRAEKWGGSGGELGRSRGENNKKNAFTLPGLHSCGKQQQPAPLLWHLLTYHEFLIRHSQCWGSHILWQNIMDIRMFFKNILISKDSSFLIIPRLFPEETDWPRCSLTRDFVPLFILGCAEIYLCQIILFEVKNGNETFDKRQKMTRTVVKNDRVKLWL